MLVLEVVEMAAFLLGIAVLLTVAVGREDLILRYDIYLRREATERTGSLSR